MTDPSDDSSALFAPWLEQLAAAVPAPGGGAAAAVTLAIGAAVTEMTAGYAPMGSARDDALAAARATRADAQEAADRDAAASDRLIAAYRLPDGPDAAAERARALAEATEASLAITRLAAPLAGVLAWLADHGDPRLAPDVVVAAHIVAAAVRGAAATARSNIASAPAGADGPRRRLAEAITIADELDAVAARVTAQL